MKLCGVVVVEDFASSRLSGGSRVPALEHVANRPILEHVVDALHLAGVEEVVVAMSAAVAGDIHRHLAARDYVAMRYLEEEKPLDLAAAIRLAAPVVGDASCIVHRATGLLDEPLTRFVTSLRDGPDVHLIVHQASTPDEHLSPATQDMLHLAEFNPEHALGMAGVWLFGPGAMPIVASSPWPVGRDVDLTSLGCAIPE
jgi:dTDP-glucose pyrophosphorylase